MAFLKKYEKLEELGRVGGGSFAQVFLVRHLEHGYLRAIRLLKNRIFDKNSKEYQDFLKEARFLMRLGNGCHPNISRIFQPQLVEDNAFWEMDYIKGNTVDGFIEQNRGFVSVAEVKRFALDIASALSYCHVDNYSFSLSRDDDGSLIQTDPNDGNKLLISEKNRKKLIQKYAVVHNDIKSNNIMRKYDGSYILIDFGLAFSRALDKDVQQFHLSSSLMNNGGIEYKAPEKWDKKASEMTERTDIYSFGIVLYEMLAGKVPFPSDSNVSQERNSYEVSEHHKNTQPPAIEPLRKAAFEAANPGKTYTKDYPDWLETVILKCLEKKPEDRYANGKELYEDVKKQIEKEAQNISVNNEELEKLQQQNQALSADLSKLACKKQQLEQQKEKVVEKIVEKRVEVPVEKIVIKEVVKEVPVEKIVYQEKIIKKNKPFFVVATVCLLLFSGVLFVFNNPNQVSKLKAENYSLQQQLSAAGDSNGVSNTPSASAGSNKTFTVTGVSFTMVYVQGGTFTMGCTSEQGDDCHSDEKPVHNVTLSSYYMGKFEVTQALWKAVMGSNPSNFKGDNLPVENVSWEDCKDFIRNLNAKIGENFRLPTEAEWEYAARGGNRSDGTKYSGGYSMDNAGWYGDNSGSTTHTVGTKSPNGLGIYDMSGNVWEWCNDWYGSYSSSSQTNPQGASSGSYRVLRGGSWYFNARYCRVSYRNYNTPSSRSFNYGFRLAFSSK